MSDPIIDVVPYNSNNLLPLPFIQQFHYSNVDNHNLIKQIIKDAEKKRTILHLLSVGGIPYGFLSLSFQCHKFHKKEPPKKILNIDYLFVSAHLRRKSVAAFGGLKTSEMLVSIAINIANQIKQFVPVDFIAAEPAHDAIAPLYINAGFSELQKTTNVLFLKL